MKLGNTAFARGLQYRCLNLSSLNFNTVAAAVGLTRALCNVFGGLYTFLQGGRRQEIWSQYLNTIFSLQKLQIVVKDLLLGSSKFKGTLFIIETFENSGSTLIRGTLVGDE